MHLEKRVFTLLNGDKINKNESLREMLTTIFCSCSERQIIAELRLVFKWCCKTNSLSLNIPLRVLCYSASSVPKINLVVFVSCI